jgi:Protein of unknown function (DUF2934)
MARQKFPKKNGDAAAGVSVSGPLATTEAASVAETVKAKPRNGDGRKPEMVKSESRGNLLPINVEEEIRRLAYLFSERRGFEPGHETEDWLNAEREIQLRYHHSA